MAPSEFWAISTQEFWWEFDFKLKQQKRLEKRSPGGRVGAISEAEWDAARKKFRERENAAADGSSR